MFLVVLPVVFLMVFASSRGYVEMGPVLEMLNIPWEGECPATPRLRIHPPLQSLGWSGRCPTIYRVLELPASSEPQAVLVGFCDPSCHNTECSPLGNFRCRNHTAPVAVASLQLTDQGLVRTVRTEDIPVGCVCESRKYTRLGSHNPVVVE